MPYVSNVPAGFLEFCKKTARIVLWSAMRPMDKMVGTIKRGRVMNETGTGKM